MSASLDVLVIGGGPGGTPAALVLAQAGKRGIVMEMVLFCPYYHDQQWDLSPIKAGNNIQGIGGLPRTKALTLDNGPLLAIQEAMVRKIVTELRDFDNVYYEICNEPYFGGVTIPWQNHIAETIRNTEAAFPVKHLIAQNISNGSKKIENPNPDVSIFNFHYAWPPVVVGMNYQLDRPVAFDETGFKGSSDQVYRLNAWEFILAGGSIFDNLDYSFTTAHPDGTAHQSAPGGGSPALRAQYHILRDFIEGFDFLRTAPAHGLIRGGATPGPNALYVWNEENPANISIKEFPPAPRAWVLAQEGKAYAVYVAEGSQVDLVLSLPAGRYRSEWVNTKSGQLEKPETFDHAGGEKHLASPQYTEDIALRINRTDHS